VDKKWIGLAILALALAVVVTVAQATPAEPALVQAGAPTVVSYQGQVKVGDSAYDGTGYFKFAIVDAKVTTSYWSNDGSSTAGNEPKATVPLEVTGGLFNVLLGDTKLQNMTQPLEAGVFENTETYLRVWFSANGRDFTQLSPDRRIAAVPYALQAAKVQGYARVVVVAKSGGDFTSIQAAVDSISGASEETPYLVWVAPGLYEETVTLKSYVHLQGAGRKATIISSAVTNSAAPPTQATVVLADETSLRDLTVMNEGTGAHNVAVLLTGTERQAQLTDIDAEARGVGEVSAYAIYVSGSWTHLTATNVSAYGHASGNSYGLYSNANATLVGGEFRGRYGVQAAYGIYHTGSELVAEGVSIESGNATDSYALYNAGWWARVHGGEVYAKGGGDTWGIMNTDGARLEVQDVSLYSEGRLTVAAPSSHVYGLENNGASTAVLRGGVFRAYGGEAFTQGIKNMGTDTSLEAYAVKAEGGAGESYNKVYGLYSGSGTSAVLRGGSYLARGGQRTRGIVCEGSDCSVDAHGITAEGIDGTTENYALFANAGAEANVRSSALVADTALRANSATVNLAMSQLAGAIDSTASTLTCYGAYNSSYGGISCP
jgi:hypothetical protein